MLMKSTFKYTVHGRFWITLSGTMGTAEDLASSMLILKILLDLGCRTGQPKNMPRSSETMAWEALCKEGNWEVSFAEASAAGKIESYFGDIVSDNLKLPLFSVFCDYKAWILGMYAMRISICYLHFITKCYR